MARNQYGRIHDGGRLSPRKGKVSVNALGGNDREKWWCKGYMNLVDTEVAMVVDRLDGVGSKDGGGESQSATPGRVICLASWYALLLLRQFIRRHAPVC